MKKWIVCMVMGVFIASSASAAIWPFGSKEEPQEQPVVDPQRERPRDMNQRGGHQISEEQRAEMRANHDAIQQLADAARTETDPVKKEALIDELRVKLTDGAEKMQAEFRKRLERAEGEVAKMKERLADAEQNIDQKVEEHLQKLLAGEKLERPEGKRSGGPPHKKPAPVE